MGEKKPDTIPEEEFGRWLIPSQAVQIVSKRTGDWDQSCRDILRRADSGLIEFRAEAIEWKQGVESGKYAKFCPIPAHVIRDWYKSDAPGFFTFWTSGDAEWEIRSAGYGMSTPPTKWRFFDIRLDPVAVAKLGGAEPTTDRPGKPAPPPLSNDDGVVSQHERQQAVPPQIPAQPAKTVAQPPQNPPSRVGRPPIDFWEDMVIAATRAILFDDTLKPKTQADVQRWMAEWAVSKGYEEPGETALKERARKVFLACRE